MMTFCCGYMGQVLRDRRIQVGWTQSDLGKALSVPQSTVSAWETGRLPVSDQVVDAVLAALPQ